MGLEQLDFKAIGEGFWEENPELEYLTRFDLQKEFEPAELFKEMDKRLDEWLMLGAYTEREGKSEEEVYLKELERAYKDCRHDCIKLFLILVNFGAQLQALTVPRWLKGQTDKKWKRWA